MIALVERAQGFDEHNPFALLHTPASSKQDNKIISTYLSRRGEEGFQCRAVISCQARRLGHLLRNNLNEEGANGQIILDMDRFGCRL
jgi:hypothetical protein